MHRSLICIALVSVTWGCADSVAPRDLDRGCYALTTVEALPDKLRHRWPSSFELSDSHIVRPGSDSASATAFWEMHKLARSWTHGPAGTALTFSTGEVVTELQLQAIGDS